MSGMTRVHEIDGSPVFRMMVRMNEREIEINKSGREHLLCPLCREPISPGTHPALLSNYKLFPNTVMHQACEDAQGGPEAAAEKLKALHDECKAAKEKFVPLGWMGNWPG